MSTASGPTAFNPQYPSAELLIAQNEALGLIAAKTIISITTPPVNTFLAIKGYISVTTATSISVNVQITWTDENSTVHTTQNLGLSPDGAAPVFTALTTTGFRDFVVKQIRAKASTTLTIATAGTFTTCVYDLGTVVVQLGTL